uniref:Phosvitin n=1 Tax=Oreochromis aureus TaxID=47969 RepID=A0AAZ1X3A5_OREAU
EFPSYKLHSLTEAVLPDPVFEAGKTYVYKYEALLLAGLLEKGSARAGLNISSKVSINAIDQNTYFIKLEEPELQEYSGNWPEDPFIPATELTSALQAELTTPIKFEYVNGAVGKVFAPETVSTTVLNIYRGILNVFQLNVKKTLNVYELQEAGTQGVCKTLYSITEDTEAERVYLRKTRDMSHCQERITKDMGLAYTEKCGKCQEDTKNLKGVSSYSYIMKPLDNGIQIKEASVHELIQFSPFSEQHGAAHMETKYVRRPPYAPTTPPPQAEYSHRGNLTYQFSTELLQLPILLLNINDIESQLEDTLNHLVKQAVERVHEDAPLEFLKFVQLLRAASNETLENLWSKHSGISAHRKWIMDAIPAVGNPDALRFIKEKYLAETITVFEAVQALITSFHMVTATTEAIEVIESLTKESKIVRNPFLRQIVFLGYGTMIYKHCYERTSCPAELIQPIQDLLAQALKDGNTEDIILFVKALGNAAHPSSLKKITKMLPLHSKLGSSLPVRVHAEAMMALKNIAKKEPKTVQYLAFQLYGDKTLHSEIRMLACMVLFETKPSMSLVSAVVHIVKTDTNMQVASFTYSHMKSLTRSTTLSCYHCSAAACKAALRMLGPNLDKLSSRFSKAIHVDVYSSPFMLGAAATAYYINDAATIMPKSITTRIKAFFAGAAADILEVGVRTEGLQEAFLKNPAVFDSADRVTRMKHVIKALSHWKSAPNSKSLTSIYVKFFGQEVAFLIFANNNADTFGRDVFKALQSGPTLRFVKPLLANEVRRIMPTIAGFPMELGLYTAAVAAVPVKVTTTPALPEDFYLRYLLKADIHISTKVTPSVAVNTFAVFGINTAILQAVMVSRAKLYSITPAKTEVTFNINEGYLNFTALPVSVPENITAVEVETFAVVRNPASGERITPVIPANPRQILITKFISQRQKAGMHIKSKMVKSKKKYCAQTVNAGLKACLKIATAYTGDAAVYKLAGKHSAAFSVTPIEGEAAERLELEVQLGSKAAQKIIKHITLREEEIPEETPVLMKLHKILASTQKNSTMSSSSSSSRSSRFQVRSSSSNSSSSSHSSRKTIDATAQQKRFLDSQAAIFGMIFRAVKADTKKQGYQFTAYMDKTTSRLQIILDDIVPDNNWRLCADGAVLSMHKVKAKMNWGAECNQYDTAITTETGLVGRNPAARLKVDWNRLPSDLKHHAKTYETSQTLSCILIQEKDRNSDKQLSLTVAVVSDKIIDLIWKTPRVRTRALHLPITLPRNEIKDLTSFSDVSGKVKHLLAAAGAAECSFTGNTLTTFNNKKLKNEMPSNCYQVLAQDGTDELKFIVLLRKDRTEQKQISVKIAHIDIDLYQRRTSVTVNVNGLEIPMSNLPYRYPQADIQIKQNGEGISVYAASYGLHEVYFDKKSWKIKVVDWMKGKTCGLCGKADGETMQEYRTPTGWIATTAVSFAHSWILPAESCRDATECRMKHESVQLEKQENVQAQNSKCYSVDPVLRCMAGCFPVRTTNVTVGFHCLPAGSSPSSMYTSVDLMETTESHLACTCTAQCA